ncbi:uncharacterized protein BCR38DRAFT_391229 [Pseudomassariella vexata]|uniref:NAD-dependent epimerase/dehydratase domain-containing protein n=1 Tax=Pseudomassariella vexata TaxID=1141098 RepID=A0A1Y2E0X0_9PEZI|nr:uncharacterized protein BCR38DRAFT_391229 [Pseudomassariella vexata]ORY65127.1 hypothetical protein BCR38DRAFT_391229 [Pseudomassariella vexata]
MVKVFLTGASGYVGGQVLHQIAASNSQLDITVLLQDKQKSTVVAGAFPSVRVVLGSLDNAELVQNEVSQADVVLNLAAAGHLKGVEAIHKGLLKRSSVKPAYWIQISGASALAAAELASPSFTPGSPSDAIFDDVSDITKLRDLIRAHPGRAVDNYMLNVAAGADNSKIKTAVVYPPIIYGLGQGPVNQRSIQIPELAKTTIQRGRGVQVGEGLARWGNVHVRDIGRLFGLLTQKAIGEDGGDEVWGENGLYLTGVGELTFGEISSKIAAEAANQKLISSDTPIEKLVRPDADTVLPHGSVLFGTNARSKARRGTELLSWKPEEGSLEEDVPRTVAREAESLAEAKKTKGS